MCLKLHYYSYYCKIIFVTAWQQIMKIVNRVSKITLKINVLLFFTLKVVHIIKHQLYGNNQADYGQKIFLS